MTRNREAEMLWRGEQAEAGVALPLALFGLVIVSILVTSALLTSTTELAISSAHQDATRGLYAADRALEGFVAERAALTTGVDQRIVSGSYTTAVGGTAFTVDVGRLHEGAVVELASGGYQQRETYSIVTQPAVSAGRGVGALIETARTALPVTLNVDSGLTLGVNTTIGGSATVSNGSSPGAACDSAAATAAIRHSADTRVRQQGRGNDIYGAIEQDVRDGAALMDYVLDGFGIDDLAELATIRFGAQYNQPAFSNGNGPRQNASHASYRWGCPAKLVSGCTAAQAAYFPVVAIDAAGSTIDITGDHGQGMLIVKNGHVHLRGNFRYQGIILVEGTLRVTGTPRLEGAVIGMGDEAVIEAGDDSEASGNSLIRFNKCEIVNAQRSLTSSRLSSSEQMVDGSTFAWFEIVR